MNNILIFFLSFYTLTTFIFIGFDLYFWFLDRFSRYKIGQWRNLEIWINKVWEIGLNWLPIVPITPVTSNSHLVLWDMLMGKYKRKSVQAWQTAGLLLGVSEYSSIKFIKVKDKTIKYFIDENGMWKHNPTNVDHAILAYALLKNNSNPNFLKPSMDYVVDLINKHIGKDRLIAYSHKKNIRYVDTLGLVCPFLILYENTYKTDKYTNLALSQIEKFIQFGLFKDTWLPVHSYEITQNLPIGVFGWGRGTGWFILALIDSYVELKDSQKKEALKVDIISAADYYLQFQREDGGFGIFIQDKETYDSSATAIFAYFYAKCFEIHNKKIYFNTLEKSILKLKSLTRRSGKLDYCQGDTVDVGIFSQRSDIMPFAQGMTLRAYSIYKKHQSA